MKLLKGLLSIALATSFSMAADYVIKFSIVNSLNTPKGKAAEYFAKRVEELSNGKIEVKVYPNAQLGGDTKVIREMKFNQVQMAAPAFSKFGKYIPELRLFDLPFLFKDANHLHRVLDGDIGKEILDKVSETGFIALGFWDNGFKQLTDSKRPLIKPDDCKGLRFRVMNSRVLKEQFKALGAIPVVIPFKKTYDALKSGFVDGEENTNSNIYTEKFYQVQKYMTLTNHGYLGYLVIVNRHFWEALPNNLKNVIKTALKDATNKERKWAKELNNEALKKIKEYASKTGKLQIITLTPMQRMEWVRRLRKIYPKFYRSIGKDLIEKAIQAEY